ncbi:tautomerase family protein [Dasania marina]|uniref:tautomerase family protein n=2 Tax=Dasania marina TaxID=471499 RepID=UPI0030DAF765|tara:strand:+ start:6944 stop:7132 length:189 start_codon:yes stop_codon:yes gene_type:complete
MPVITIQQIAGRTQQQKSEVMKKITEAFVDVYQVPAEGVMIIFQDLQDEDWGRNGVLHSEKS